MSSRTVRLSEVAAAAPSAEAAYLGGLPDDTLSGDERARLLAQARARLTKGEWAVFALYVGCHLDADTIALALSLHRATVYRRLARARTRVRVPETHI